jgi:hypothetical protein
VPEGLALRGISRLLAQAALVRQSGADVYPRSTFDGPLDRRGRALRPRALRTTPRPRPWHAGPVRDELTVLPVELAQIRRAQQARPGV